MNSRLSQDASNCWTARRSGLGSGAARRPWRCLQRPVDGADKRGPIRAGLAPFVGGKPALDLGPAPQGVTSGVRRWRREASGASLPLHQLVDRLPAPARAGRDLRGPHQLVGVDVDHHQALHGLDRGDDRVRGVGAPRSNAAKATPPLVPKVASSQPASKSASRRSSVSSPWMVSSKPC